METENRIRLKLVRAAAEINEELGLNPKIDLFSSDEELIEKLKEASQLIILESDNFYDENCEPFPMDNFSKSTLGILIEIGSAFGPDHLQWAEQAALEEKEDQKERLRKYAVSVLISKFRELNEKHRSKKNK
jgi:hypothetical protein